MAITDQTAASVQRSIVAPPVSIDCILRLATFIRIDQLGQPD